MDNVNADFTINNNSLEAEYLLNSGGHFDCSFELFAAGTVWGSISGTLSNQTDLQNALNSKQNTISDISTIRENAQNGNSAYETIQTYGNIVNYNASDFATSAQGILADSALQPGGNISELVNNVGYITSASLPTVNDGTLNIQVNGTSIGTFTANQAGNTTANIVVPDSATWGNITGTLSNQTDLQNALNAKYDASNPNGYITGISSGDVTTALGYIPYNSTNPDGYITSSALSNYVTLNTAQTISGSKAFSQPLVVADNVGLASGTLLSNNKILQRTTDNTLTLNNVNNKLRFVGSEARPQYNSADLALYSDLPTLADLTTQAQLDAINSGATSTNITQITTNTNAISDINDLIPAQATSLNQLADKDFVNSSIATNTANFIGTFNSVADLEAYSGPLTNNDYAFVIGTDAEGNTVYDRYKYTDATTPPSWVFEYELNNSSFTAAQWDSINSGITSTDVSLITTALQPNDNISELVNDAGYITGVNWGDIGGTLSNQTDLSNALNAKYDASNPNGYQENVIETVKVNGTALAVTSKAVDITVPTDTSDLTNGAGYITGITSSDVTTALGYTPYNSTNPNGYITSSALSGYATETWVGQQGYALSSSLSIVATSGSYADLSNKPTIPSTASDVGALPDTTKYGADLSYNSNTLQLLDQDGNDLGSPVTIQSSPDIDGKSITTNSDDELQTVGVIDQNNTTNAIKTWTGTKAQYEAIVTKDATTLYNITDDTDVTFTLLELLFPVGAVYFGTMSVCPLQTLGVGTWQALPQDKVIQIAGTRGSVGDTLNESLPNITGYIQNGSHSFNVGNSEGDSNSSLYSPGIKSGATVAGNSGSDWKGDIAFDASRSSSTYQNDAPVQQDAYLLNGWRRIS